MKSMNAVQTHPDWLIDAAGARQALDAWQRAEADALPLRAAQREAIAGAAGFVRWEGQPGEAFMAPARGVSTADFDAKRKASQTAGDAVAAVNRRIGRAKTAYDALIRSGGDTALRNRVAAGVALAKHNEAVTAWEIVVRALADRDAAYEYAGRPGVAWWNRTYIGNPQANTANDHAIRALSVRVNDFDVDAVTDAAQEV
jgi:hypothetical protein